MMSKAASLMLALGKPKVLWLSTLAVVAPALVAGKAFGGQEPTGPQAARAARARVEELEKRVANWDSRQTRGRDLAQLKSVMSNFVIGEIRAYPWISPERLSKQLAYVYPCAECEHPPAAFADNEWEPNSKRRVWAVVYWVYLGSYSSDGSATVIDSYVWNDGAVRLTGSRGAEMAGKSLNTADLIDNSARDSLSVLVSGTVLGGSGRVISGIASLYSIGPKGVALLWRTPPEVGNLRIGAGRELRGFLFRSRARVSHSSDPAVGGGRGLLGGAGRSSADSQAILFGVGALSLRKSEQKQSDILVKCR